MNTQFDIIVAGAGISGLLLASELSSQKKVLVIETKKELDETKYWVTLKSCLESNVELAAFVDTYFKYMDFSDASQNVFRLTGDYILWNTVSLVNYLKQKIFNNNGEIKFNQRFCGYKSKTNSIELFVNDQCYTTKLFIDCMGYNSPLVLAKDMVRFKGFYLLYGAKLRLQQPIDPICNIA
jgi:flavin-dependent dehydrogenase